MKGAAIFLVACHVLTAFASPLPCTDTTTSAPVPTTTSRRCTDTRPLEQATCWPEDPPETTSSPVPTSSLGRCTDTRPLEQRTCFDNDPPATSSTPTTSSATAACTDTRPLEQRTCDPDVTAVPNSVNSGTNGTSRFTSSSGYKSDVRPGVPGFPLNQAHLTAKPLADAPAPAGAAVYKPHGFLFDCDDFANWTQAQIKRNPTKWFVIQPGTYEYKLGDPAPAGADPDPNLYAGRNIRFVFYPAGWTLDLRGVTFSIPVTPKNSDLRPWDAIYVNQSPDFTILGGTIWFDQGEIYSYATITDLSSTAPGLSGDEQLATIKLDKGYNASVWATDVVNPGNVACYDISDWPRHVTDPKCNFQYMHNYTFDVATSSATAVFGMTRSGIKQGMVLVRDLGFNALWAVGTETEGGLHVRGMTTNGGFIQIGTNDNGATAVFEDCYVVNPPKRPGFAPRYGGPSMQWGHLGATYNGPSTPAISFPNSFLQDYGGSKDLVPIY